MIVGSIHLFDEPIFPFETEVKFKPISSKNQGRVHQFGTKVLGEKVGLVIF